VQVWQLADGAISQLASLPRSTGCSRPAMPAQSVTLVVVPLAGRACAAISVSPAALPDAKVGVPYAQTFSASGGSGTLGLAFDGALPGGLGFAGAQLSGTPTVAGSYYLRFAATDAKGCRRERAYRLLVAPSNGLAPLALTVDASGNGVLDFAETASFVPTWRNLSPSSAACGHRVVAHRTGWTGLRGPDSAASYGPIASGADGVATLGYEVGTRAPAAGLDAVATEGAKAWTVHSARASATLRPETPPIVSSRPLSLRRHRRMRRRPFLSDTPVPRREMSRLLLRAKQGAAYAPAAAQASSSISPPRTPTPPGWRHLPGR
jgi:hypothetical protein